MTIIGAAGVVTVDAVPGGDPYKGLNTQQYGFQLGVDVTPESEVFRAHTRVLAPFSGVQPAPHQSMGLFIGTGDQDNYTKIVVKYNGLQFLSEINGQIQGQQNLTKDITGADYIDLMIEVDPASSIATGYYAITMDGVTGAEQQAGSFVFPIDWLTADTRLAIGILSTSFGAEPFPATWDFLTVKKNIGNAQNTAPVISIASLSDVVPGAPVRLNTQVVDDGLPNETLSFEWSVITAPGTVSFADETVADAAVEFSAAGTYVLELTVSDGELSSSETVTVDVINEVITTTEAIYRLNVGGPALTGGWEADNGYVNSGKTWSSSAAVDTAGVNGVPAALFNTERYDPPGGAPIEWELPVEAGNYQVRLYFAEIFFGAMASGVRVFDAEVEGENIDGIDVFAAVGGNSAYQKTVTVQTDNTLNIRLLRQSQNPALKGIEVVKISGGGPNPVTPPADNKAPIVVAGADQQLDLPSVATLVGSVTDDGLPQNQLSSVWVLQSGPASVTIDKPDALQTTVRFNKAGSYVFRLNATDTDLSAFDQMTVVVNEEEELPPASAIVYRINAGGGQVSDAAGVWMADNGSFRSGGNSYATSASINTGSTPDVPKAVLQTERWQKGSMAWQFPVTPGRYEVRLHFAEIFAGAMSPGARVFDVSVEGQVRSGFDVYNVAGALAGVSLVYQVVSDNKLDIKLTAVKQNPAIKGIEILSLDTAPVVANTAPQVDAGADQSASVGQTVALSGVADDDDLPNGVLSYQWSMIDGPASVSFDAADQLNSNVTFETEGTYRLELKVSDGELTATDTVTVEVSGAATRQEVVYRINAGGPALAASPINWQADKFGSAYVNTGKTWAANKSVDTSNTPDIPEALFTTERYDLAGGAALEYSLPVANGSYIVNLYFAEIWQGAHAVGKRVFDVSVEGQTLSTVDAFAEAGANRSLVKSLDVAVTDGVINIVFDHVVQNPSVKGIEVIAVDGSATTDNQTPTISANTAWNRVITSDGSKVAHRHEAGGVVLNGKLYVLGGRGSRPVNVYDPVLKRWETKSAPPVELNHFQPVAFDNKIWVIGAFKGRYPSEDVVPNIYTYDPATDQWNSVGTLPQARRRGAAGLVVHNDLIYMVGGNPNGHRAGAVSWFDSYNPRTNQWQVLPDAPHARDHVTVSVSNNKLVVAAGRKTVYPNPFANTVGATDVYNFDTGSWQQGKAIPTQRAGAMTVTVGDEVVVIGGEIASQLKANDEVEAYNTKTNQWRVLKPLAVGRHSGAAGVLAGQIHVISGSERRGGSPESTVHEVLSIE